MKSLLRTALSSGQLWEFSFILIGVYLFLNPCWTYPQSTAVALGGGLALFLFRSVPGATLSTLGKPWILFIGYLLLSVFWSSTPGLTLQSTGLVCLGTVLFIMAGANTLEAQDRLETWGLALAFLASLMAVYQWLFGFERLAPLLGGLSGEEHEILKAAIHNRRAAGPFATHGALAAFLILLIPVGFIKRQTGSGLKRVVFGVATFTLLLGLLATQSVGAFVCLTLASLAVLLKRKSKTLTAAAIGAGVLGTAVLIFARGLQSWILAALGTRVILWKAALGLFASHPWWGTGLGSFDEIYQRAGLPLDTGARFPHNLILQILVETGIAGSLIILAALADVWRRLKIPSRWEGWGAGTGVLAFLLFSLLDLPFQMPELVWFFAAVSGRLGLNSKPQANFQREGNKTRRKYFFDENLLFINRAIPFFLLIILLVSGFWPPFRAWNFAMLAVVLWALVGWFQARFEKIPFWVAAGALFLGLRGFFSPSALGTVWFLEISGILLAFYLLLPCFEKPGRFLRIFFGLGLAWALKVWWISFHYAAPGIGNWIHFQFSDVKDWMIFPNPKQVGIFLVPLLLALVWKPLGVGNLTAGIGALLTMARLRASSPAAGLGAGIFYRIWMKSRLWAVVFLFAAGGALTAYRMSDPSATSGDRINIWKDSLKVWRMNPVIGVGPGAFAGLYHQVKTPRTSGISRYLMDAEYSHNEFLELLTAFGLVGFVFGLLLLLKAWRKVRGPNARAGLMGLGAASFVDFCLHTPLIALQGIGLLAGEGQGKPKGSPAAGFLVLGLGLGLFGSPVYSLRYKNQAENHLAKAQFFPEDLRALERAERLNAWDSRYAEANADYLERLFSATKDQAWARKSDEAFERALDLEKADGGLRFKNAERLTARLTLNSKREAAWQAALAWETAGRALPFDAFVNFEEGQFFLREGDKEMALSEFEAAALKEPNFAAAWMISGRLALEKGDGAMARRDYRKALDVCDQWKGAERIDPLEKQMVTLPGQAVAFLRRETAK